MSVSKRPIMVLGSDDESDVPVQFVDPIRPHTLCSVCECLNKMTALLPCTHALCETCYLQCGVDGGRVCPIDSKKCSLEDIGWKEFAIEQLLKAKVRCPNLSSGCEAVMSASEVFDHLRNECAHYPDQCPRCSTSAPHGSMRRHMKLDCLLVNCCRPEPSDGEISREDKVDEPPKPDWDRCQAENTEAVKPVLRPLPSTGSPLRLPEPQQTLSSFAVKSVAWLQQKSEVAILSIFDIEAVYLRGYYIEPGVAFTKHEGRSKLYVALRLLKGDHDDAVQWPFEHQIRLGIIRPKDGAERWIVVRPRGRSQYFEKPKQQRLSGVYFRDQWLDMDCARKDGYVEQDQLLVKFELLP